VRALSILAAAALSVVLACAREAPFTDAERDVVATAVDSATHDFRGAERDRDADRMIAHMAPSFYMYDDGSRKDYQETVASIRATMPSLRYFETEWSDIESTVLGPNGAVVSFTFRDSLVDASGGTVRLDGATTFVWERFENQWRLVYAQVDRFPADTASGDS